MSPPVDKDTPYLTSQPIIELYIVYYGYTSNLIADGRFVMCLMSKTFSPFIIDVLTLSEDYISKIGTYQGLRTLSTVFVFICWVRCGFQFHLHALHKLLQSSNSISNETFLSTFFF